MASDPTASAIATLHPAAGQLARVVVQAARDAGWPVVIYPAGARRSQAYQDRLYAQGRTSPGRIVTYTRASKHIEGLAFDLDLMGYPRDAGMPLWKALGSLWKAGGYRWGGDWGDYGHFEL